MTADEPPPFCELLPEPKSLVTLENTALSTIVFGVQCGTLTNVGVPYALNFQVEEDPTLTTDTIKIEMSPPNLVNPMVENGRLVFMANLDGASISSPGLVMRNCQHSQIRSVWFVCLQFS